MNPYQPPTDTFGPTGPTGLPPDERARLREVAKYQRSINLVMLAYFGAGVVTQVLQEVAIGRIIVGIFALGVIIAGVVFAVQMARALYSTGVAVLCGILLLIPCLGLLVLLVLNNRATARLKAAGIPVGILGADPGDVSRVLGAP